LKFIQGQVLAPSLFFITGRNNKLNLFRLKVESVTCCSVEDELIVGVEQSVELVAGEFLQLGVDGSVGAAFDLVHGEKGAHASRAARFQTLRHKDENLF